MKKRVPLQVAPEFRDALRKIQGELLLLGKSKSLRDITLELVNMNKVNIEQMKREINIRMDERRRYG
jgi:hypothetical protein